MQSRESYSLHAELEQNCISSQWKSLGIIDNRIWEIQFTERKLHLFLPSSQWKSLGISKKRKFIETILHEKRTSAKVSKVWINSPFKPPPPPKKKKEKEKEGWNPYIASLSVPFCFAFVSRSFSTVAFVRFGLVLLETNWSRFVQN